MSPNLEGRTAKCDRAQAQIRLQHAKKFYEVAELVALEGEEVPASSSVAAALAVLAGIAASDAACCIAMGRRSRRQNHRQAVELLQQVSPGGTEVARQLGRLLDIKDTAHYGVISVSGPEFKAALRCAQALVEFADACLRR